MLSTELSQWQANGDFIETAVFNHKVFYCQFGNTAATAENTLLILHGFPESSFSFHKVVEGLLQKFERVLLFDMLGYGLSDKPTSAYSYSLFEQADTALQVWQQLGISGGHLLAHDMGDSVATELVARHVSATLPAFFNAGFQSFTFTNGSMVLNLASLRLGQKILLSKAGGAFSKLNNKTSFTQQVRSAHGNNGLSDHDIDLMWENLSLNNGHHNMHRVIQYLNDRKRFEKTRWLPALAKVTEPVHICWGEADAVANVAMAHYLKANICTAATVTLMPHMGHFCQISDPEVWLNNICEFYYA